MKKAFALLLVAFLGLGVSSLRAQPAGLAPPTTQELQVLLDEQKYADVIKETQRMLRLKGEAAKAFDRFDVLMIRAEAFLQNKQQAQAAQAYKEAGTVADDPTRAGLPKAMVKLLQRSRAFMFTPKPSKDPTTPAAPLSILEPESRKQALQVLFEEEWKPTQAKIETLKKRANSLPAILEASQLAGEIRGLEIAATGSDAQTSTALSDLTDSAARLMKDYLDRQTRRVEEIDRAANMPINDTGIDTARRGLTAQQANDLRGMVRDAGLLNTAAQQVANGAGSQANEFKSIADRSVELGRRANDLLMTDFTSYQDRNAHRPIQRGGESQPRRGYGPR